MEDKIMEVLRCMHGRMDDKGLAELKQVLDMVFAGCRLDGGNQLRANNGNWICDLEDFLISKSLEGKSKETVCRYKYELTRLLSYINKNVSDITDADVSNFLLEYKRRRKVSNQTLKNVRAVYSSFFAWLRDRDRIQRNPMVLVEGIKAESKIKLPYSVEEQEMLLRSCTCVRDKAMLEFLYSTAVRVSELAALDIADVQFVNRELVVFGKGGKERRTYLNDRAYMYLKEYLQSRTDNNPALFVSLRKPHERLTKSGIENMIRKVGKQSGVDKAHPHRFQRTALTNALNRGMPIQEAMILAGHAKPETTMRYCTVDQEGVRYHHKKYLI